MIYLILAIFIALIILMLNLMLFALLTVFERRNRIKRLRKNLANFSPNQLENRIERYSKTIVDSQHKNNIEDNIKEITTIDYKSINRKIKEVEKYTMPIKAFNFIKFNQEYKQLIEKVNDYEISYLENRFQLFDLTSDIEIEKTILDSLKSRFSKVKDMTFNNPLVEIRENKKINNKLTRISTSLKKIEELIENQIKHLGPDFIELVRKTDKDIKTLANDLDFMNFYIKHLEEELLSPMQQIVDVYSDNKAVLNMLEKDVKARVILINSLKKEIREDIPELRTKKVIDNTTKLDTAISELNLLIRSNIDFARFNKAHQLSSTKLLEFIRENNGLFISEIKRHKISDETNRIMAISSALSVFEKAVDKYDKEQASKFHVHAPQGISNLILEVVYAYQNYIKVVEANVIDINSVNDATNKVNKEISDMNAMLLQAELNISILNGMFREEYEKEKIELQRKVELLWIKFKENTEEVPENVFGSIAKFKERIAKLVSLSRGKAFEYFFTKETILFLNKYKGTNAKFDDILNSINESFYNEKYNEALRKAKEVIEIYGIK